MVGEADDLPREDLAEVELWGRFVDWAQGLDVNMDGFDFKDVSRVCDLKRRQKLWSLSFYPSEKVKGEQEAALGAFHIGEEDGVLSVRWFPNINVSLDRVTLTSGLTLKNINPSHISSIRKNSRRYLIFKVDRVDELVVGPNGVVTEGEAGLWFEDLVDLDYKPGSRAYEAFVEAGGEVPEWVGYVMGEFSGLARLIDAVVVIELREGGGKKLRQIIREARTKEIDFEEMDSRLLSALRGLFRYGLGSSTRLVIANSHWSLISRLRAPLLAAMGDEKAFLDLTGRVKESADELNIIRGTGICSIPPEALLEQDGLVIEEADL